MKKILFSILMLCFLTFSCKEKTKVPYTVTEKKNIKLSYIVDDEKLYYERISGSTLLGILPEFKVYCYVINTSDYGGVFKLEATVVSQGNTIKLSDKEYIESGKKVKLSATKEINHYSFQTNIDVDWQIIAPSKSIDVEVTKYRYE